jgi:hypothetical protein
MAGIFQNGVWSCGFDFLPTAAVPAGGVFDIGSTSGGGCNVSAAYARFSGKGVNVGGAVTYCGRSFNTNLATFIHGFACNFLALPASAITCFLTLYDATAGNQQLSLGCDSTGALGFYSAGGLPGSTGLSGLIGVKSAAGTIVPGAYNFIEFLATISSGAGVLTLRVNGTTVISFAGNTQVTANAYANRIYWGMNGTNTAGGVNLDDFYLLDMTGVSPLNAFLGNGRIQTDGPNADSATGGLNTWAFTTPQGSDFGNFAQIPANPADFNSSGSVGARASCKFPSLGAIARVAFFNCWQSSQLDAAGARTIATVYRNNSVDQTGPTITPSNGSYAFSNTASVIDPNTGQPWANGPVANTTNMEIGPQVIS